MIVSHSVTTLGTQPINITVEVTKTSGLPQIFLLGLGTNSTRDATLRIKTALRKTGVQLKAVKTIINISSSSLIRKANFLDLAVAVALINLFHPTKIPTEKSVFLGSLALDGSVTQIDQCLIKVLAAKSLGYKKIFLPTANAANLPEISDIQVYAVNHLSELLEYSVSTTSLKPYRPHSYKSHSTQTSAGKFWTAIQGQETAKRAALICAAGYHNLHLVGPPGLGKTMLAHATHELLPEMILEDALHLSAVTALRETSNHHVSLTPPFRVPVQNATITSLIGSQATGTPGDLPLAHQGILFLDELPLFKKQVIDALRQPLEQKIITLEVHNQPIEYLADAIIIAAMNPCGCGYWGSGIRECKCSLHQRLQYFQKVSGPLLDRFDLSIMVCEEKVTKENTMSLLTAKKIVEKVRSMQANRYRSADIHHNSQLTYHTIKNLCTVGAKATTILDKAIPSLRLSHRAIEKTLAVAQTIADINSHHVITATDMSEALQYRFERRW